MKNRKFGDEEGMKLANSKLTAAAVYLPEKAQWQQMLEPMLFTPAALWVSKSLLWAGVEKFLVICPADALESARSCFPEEAVFLASDDEELSDKWNHFMKNAGGRVAVVTKPVLFFRQGAAALTADKGLSPGDGAAVARTDAPVLMDALETPDGLSKALKGSGSLGAEAAVLESGSAESWVSQSLAKKLVNDYWLQHGVAMLDPQQVYIAPTVTVEAGTTLLPGTILRGETHIGKGCEIGPNTMLRDVTVGESTTVNFSQASECSIGSHTTVGPFAYIRPNTTVGDRVKVGDFVELKNSVIGDDTKISHLTYVGDSDVGEHINFGCGTVTVNYDGAKKFRTTIGDGAFIGCNTNLVAPVTVGPGAYIAAGSTITRDVPSDSLAIARSQQTVKNQWAKKRRNKQQGK